MVIVRMLARAAAARPAPGTIEAPSAVRSSEPVSARRVKRVTGTGDMVCFLSGTELLTERGVLEQPPLHSLRRPLSRIHGARVPSDREFHTGSIRRPVPLLVP
jgi:hypothetical protein